MRTLTSTKGISAKNMLRTTALFAILNDKDKQATYGSCFVWLITFTLAAFCWKKSINSYLI